jgi:hypothetical protein
MTVSPFQTSEKSQQETISCRGNRHSFQLFSGHSQELYRKKFGSNGGKRLGIYQSQR